ncbi:MAG: tagaturonate reductase [Cruoricaptor ignavus]|nr:tagaturonate reductase [Cruoricaptor ignavus]
METQTKPKLNRELLGKQNIYPIKVLQFGEGNFLRAFVDYAFYRLNNELNFDAGIAVVQPLPGGLVNKLQEQDFLYTLFLNGVKNGEKIQRKELVDNIVQGVNPYTEFQKYLELAKSETLQFVISNTTEAGIEFVESDIISDECPKSFPAKLAVFLYKRFQFFNGDKTKGLAIIPCELINYNADTLKDILHQYIQLWNLGSEFGIWIDEACTFHNTLVDRIVPGYPKNEIEEYNSRLDYADSFMVTAEPFFLWVIEGDEKLKEQLPFHKTNLDVKIVPNMQPYRTRKVRILNGIHTAMVPLSILYGNETVQQTVDNPFTADFVQSITFGEIVPTLDMDKDELKLFAEEVLDRFRNPFIKHQLSDIALNSVSKFKVRVLPTILEYYKLNNKIPINLVFGFACLLRFYKGTWDGKQLPVRDSADVVETFSKIWQNQEIDAVVTQALANEEFWGENLNEISGLKEAIALAINEIEANGIEQGYKNYNNYFS